MYGIMANSDNTFYCPYCGNRKEKSKLKYKYAIKNLQLSSRAKDKINKICAHKHLLLNYTIYRVPICNDCLSLIREAQRKATLSAFAIFIPLAFLLYYFLYENGRLRLFISLIGLLGFVCLVILWHVNTKVLVKKGVAYSSEWKEYKITYGVLDPFSQLSWTNIEYNSDLSDIE